jgi:hypothetical protein
MIYDQCLDFTIRTLKALHRASRSSMMRVWSDVGKERLEVNHSPHGQRKPSALAGDLVIPFTRLRWLHRPGSTTNGDGHPSERLRRQMVAFRTP